MMRLMHGNCLERMGEIEDGSVDMVMVADGLDLGDYRPQAVPRQPPRGAGPDVERFSKMKRNPAPLGDG